MVITLTSIRLKSLWKFFALSYYAPQTKSQPGFITMKSRGFGYDHYTLSVWDDEQSLLKFARTGAHLEAMNKSRHLATEIRMFTYTADTTPDWKMVKLILLDKGKVSSFR